jgi:hypothetical protein
VSVESEDPKDVSEKFRDIHPGFDGVDGLGRPRAHLMRFDLGLAMDGSRSSLFSVKNSSYLARNCVRKLYAYRNDPYHYRIISRRGFGVCE